MKLSIPIDLQEKLQQYWDFRLKEEKDLLENNFFEYFLFWESMEGGILSILIYSFEEERILHHYGILSATHTNYLFDTAIEKISGESALKEDLPYEEISLYAWTKKIQFGEKEYLIGILAIPSENLIHRIQKIERVFLRYYLPESFFPDTKGFPLNQFLEKDILEEIKPFLEKKLPVSFTYFAIEPLHPYIPTGGEIFIEKALLSIRNQIQGKFKSGDLYYLITPQEHLVISPNCPKEVIQKRFERFYIEVEPIIISPRIYLFTTHSPLSSLKEVWKHWKKEAPLYT